MNRRGAILLFTLAVLPICAPLASAQNETIEQRILRPVGPPSPPVAQNIPNFPPAKGAVSVLPTIAGQVPGLPVSSTITFDTFMQKVERWNLDLAAQQYNVPIARAQVVAAKVYPDPLFQAGYSGDVSNNRQVTAYTGSLTQEVLIGGKIGARTQAARDDLSVNEALLEDYLRNLRAQAANAFIDGIVGVLKLHRKVKALERAHQLVELNEERLRKNEISEDEMMRARISELETNSDLYDSQSALHETLGGLAVFMGARESNGLIVPQGNLEGPPRTFDLNELIAKAVSSRYDVIAARYSVENARDQYRIAKLNRIPDLTLSGNYAHFTRVTNPIDPSPAWDGAGISISFPLPISDLNHGTVDAAYYQILQSQKNLQSIRLQAETDVRVAYEHYQLSVAGTEQFGSELMRDADQVYKDRLFKLEKGKVTLIDVLDAHQALDQLYFDYYNALSREAKALVELEQAAGIWDVDF